MDLLFHDMASYDRARHSGLLEPGRVAPLYGVDPAVVRVFHVPEVLAIKISFPRPIPSGGVRSGGPRPRPPPRRWHCHRPARAGSRPRSAGNAAAGSRAARSRGS
ncbi:MAG: DUF4387 family protein, partial [Acetobacteraceae bacterium]